MKKDKPSNKDFNSANEILGATNKWGAEEFGGKSFNTSSVWITAFYQAE